MPHHTITALHAVYAGRFCVGLMLQRVGVLFYCSKLFCLTVQGGPYISYFVLYLFFFPLSIFIP